MSERVIAVCNPELHGDTLWSVPAARGLAARHGCRADFWLSHRGRNLADLLSAQQFVRRVVVDEHWNMLGDCSVTQRVGGHWVTEPPGRSHTILAAEDADNGYEHVYQLGFSSTLGLSGMLLDYFCRLAGMERQGHHLDLPAGLPSEPYPEGPFVVMHNKGPGEMARLGWYDVFRDFVRRCPVPVVEVGPPGFAMATDLGAIDRCRPGFLEMAALISKCRCFLGALSAPLVVADAFPHVVRIAACEPGANITMGTTSGGMNHYHTMPSADDLLQHVR